MSDKYKLARIDGTLYLSGERPDDCPMPLKQKQTFEFLFSAEHLLITILEQREKICLVGCDLDCPSRKAFLDKIRGK